MGDFRDLPLLPEAPATARITTWQVTTYRGFMALSTIMLRFSFFFCFRVRRLRCVASKQRIMDLRKR
ncbi:MAG: hypothetical protein CME04_10985 [Gemmatimonadaceae bacterium]|nr:hypothetical protein [Gemmatimonadaceae bacterium]